MNILVTNDDGIHAEGLRCLVQHLKLKKSGRVTVVAPLLESSAVGHAITMDHPLRVEKVYDQGEFFGFGVSGTPADCVKLAIREILRDKPDWVLSGINRGENSAVNIIYSGTVSAATEAAILSCSAMAISLVNGVDASFDTAAVWSLRLWDQVRDKTLPQDTFLNVNVPALVSEKIKGIKVAVQGRSRFIEQFDKRVDPRGREYYWLAGDEMSKESLDHFDDKVLKDGYVSLTPLHCDLTNHGFLGTLRDWVNHGG